MPSLFSPTNQGSTLIDVSRVHKVEGINQVQGQWVEIGRQEEYVVESTHQCQFIREQSKVFVKPLVR